MDQILRKLLCSSLPPVDLSNRPTGPSSGSPPPGRPGHEYTRDNKRGRGSSGSDSGQNSSKVQKQSEEIDEEIAAETENTLGKVAEKAVLVGEAATSQNNDRPKNVIDPGMVISIQGTPSKIYPSLVDVQSPIISRTGRNNTK